jgi:hypothetical protein
MTDFVAKPQVNELIKLSGKIKNYQARRASASFVFSEENQNQLGVIAIAAALAEMGGQAASTVAAASDTEEVAEYVEFNLDEQTLKGWIWRSPFREGDDVAVAAQWQLDHYELFGIARPRDRMIALYPHCSRAKVRHVKNAIKWWAICTIIFFSFMAILALLVIGKELLQEPAFYWGNGFIAIFFILMFTSLARQFMPFVRVAQKVFVALDLPDAKNIDLVKSSQQQRTKKDPPEFGTFYFRY